MLLCFIILVHLKIELATETSVFVETDIYPVFKGCVCLDPKCYVLYRQPHSDKNSE